MQSFDRLSQLPDDVLVSIMYRLSTKEAAQLSVVSKKWNKLWACYPGILNFEYPITEDERWKRWKELSSSDNIKARKLISQSTRNFVRWITHVVEQHVGRSLEKFRVAFDLNNTNQSDIDKWVLFALLKGVSSLELEFNANQLRLIHCNFYSMTLECCIPLHNKPNRLKTLVLSHMEITAQVLEFFLQSCQFLENLRLCNISSLGSIRPSHSLPALKYFDVSDSQLEIVDISAPKLFMFRYYGCIIQLNIQNALSLSQVSIGSVNHHPTYAFESITKYSPQLEYIYLMSNILSLDKLVIPPVSNLTNLKHLRLRMTTYSHQSLLGWIALMEASPMLEKFTLELISFRWDLETAFEKHTSSHPLKRLRTLEVYGFVGLQHDLELITYMLENAVALEEVVIDLKGAAVVQSRLRKASAEAKALNEKLPPGAKLVINYDNRLYDIWNLKV